MDAVQTPQLTFAQRRIPRAVSGALAAMCVLACSPASAQSQGSYLEAMGATVPVNQPQDNGRDVNPLLAQGQPVPGPAAAGHQPAPPAPQAAQSQGFNPFAPTHNGGVDHTSNVTNYSNVPVPGGQGGSQIQFQQQALLPQEPAPQPTHNPNQPHQNVAQVEPLPNPKLDIPKEAINRLAPASPEELRKILMELYQRQGAAVTPPNNAFVGRASQYMVDLSPGATPPVVRVARGVGATVSFVDAAGNPWPILFAKNFYAEATTVTQMAPHVLSVASVSPHLSGSVAVILKGLTTPVNFIATPAQTETDYRADLQIPGLSPDAPPVPGALSTRPDITAGNLMDFLYGATPNGATRLEVKGAAAQQSNTRAWQNTNGQLVIRTSAQVISPGWYSMQPALDGTAVYALPNTPVVRVSVDGREQTIMIEGLVPAKGK